MSVRKMHALVTSEVTEEFLAALTERQISYERAGWGVNGVPLSKDEILEKAELSQIVIIELENIDRNIISNLPNLKFVGVSRGSPVNVDLQFCKELNIKVVHTPGRNADSVADYCVGMMIDASRKLSASGKHLQKEGWMFDGKLPYLEFRGQEIRNLTVGLYGFGQIGRRVAARLKKGFNTEVLFFDPFVESDAHARRVSTLDELFTRSDIVSLHAPVLNETKDSVNSALLKKLGKSGFLINSARADLVKEMDLYESLSSGLIGGAVLDVYWNEPLDVTSKWLRLPNVICTPHIAGASSDVVNNHCRTILDGIDEWLSNQQLEGANTHA
jgi:D-3-phosphoglycerate dehydrogenase